jgi:hypothetical protein
MLSSITNVNRKEAQKRAQALERVYVRTPIFAEIGFKRRTRGETKKEGCFFVLRRATFNVEGRRPLLNHAVYHLPPPTNHTKKRTEQIIKREGEGLLYQRGPGTPLSKGARDSSIKDARLALPYLSSNYP